MISSLYVHPGSLNVGIGTSIPLATLDVNGTIRASNISIIGDFVTLNTVTSNTEQMVIQNAGTGPALKVTQTGANSIAEFYDDGGILALKIADGGNVGIGTATPTQKFQVVGAIKATTSINSDTQFLGQSTDSATTPSFSFIDDTNTGIFKPAADNVAISCGGTERMRVLSNGNVGIGTTSPLANLHVQGRATVGSSLPNSTLTTKQINIIGNKSIAIDGSSYEDMLILHKDGPASVGSGGSKGSTFSIGLDYYQSPGNHFPRTRTSFKTTTLDNDSANPTTNVMTLVDTGNVGIGITNPLAKLHVNGNFYAPGSVVQFQGKNVNANAVTSSQSYVASGISISITPKYSTSKIFFHFAGTGYTPDANNGVGIAIYRRIGTGTMTMVYGGSVFGLADAHNMQGYVSATGNHSRYVVSFIDTPNSALEVTYEVYIRSYQALLAYLGNGGHTPVDIHVFEIAV
jgi:hypothetical protein